MLRQSIFPVRRNGNAVTVRYHPLQEDISSGRRIRTAANRFFPEFRGIESYTAEWKTLFDNLGIYFFIVKSDGEILESNRSLCAALGYRRREILEGGIQGIIAPARIADFAVVLNGTRHITRMRVETVFRCKNGQNRPVAVMLRRIRFGNSPALLAAAFDIGESPEEERFRRQFRASPFPTLIWRKQNGRFMLADYNNAAESCWGILEACIGEGAETLYESNPEIIGILHRCFDAKKRIELETECSTGGGGKRCRMRLTFEFSPPDSIFMYSENVSGWREQEEKLRAYQCLLRSLSAELSLTEEYQRQSIAADLHDCVNQSLAIAQFKLEELESENHPEREKVRDIRRIVEKAIQGARDLSFELSPPILHESGFQAAAEWLSLRFQQERGVPVRFQCDRKGERFAADVEILLFKALRELFHNIHKHARASTIRISIRTDHESIYVTIEDDGRGFDTSQSTRSVSRKGGFGLFSIRERLRCLGGELEIESALSQGTRCTLRAPMEKRS